MPACKNCHRQWSWWQTLKKTFSFRIGITCPFCHEKQYFSARYRMRSTIIPVVISPLIMYTGIYFGFSYISLLIAMSILVGFFAVNPFLLELTNKKVAYLIYYCMAFLCFINEADMYKIRENQIRVKVIKCAFVNVSPCRNTPMMSMMVGAIYCKNPIVDSGMYNTALPNNSNGKAVAIPEKMSRK